MFLIGYSWYGLNKNELPMEFFSLDNSFRKSYCELFQIQDDRGTQTTSTIQILGLEMACPGFGSSLK